MLQIRFINVTKGPLWLVDSTYSIGTASTNPIQTSYGPEHQADLLVEASGVSLTNLADPSIISVNGRGLGPGSVNNIKLIHGDTFRMGGLELKLIDPRLEKMEQSGEPASKSKGLDHSEWSLQAMNHALANREFSLKDVGVIGRSNSCDISLGVAHLSRKHAKYTVSALGVRIEDLGSSNGTFVNGQRIHQAFLKNGDELSFDTLRFRVIGPDSPNMSDVDDDKTTIRPSHIAFATGSPTADVKSRQLASSSAIQRPAAQPRRKVKSLAALNVSDNAPLPYGVSSPKKEEHHLVFQERGDGTVSKKAIAGVTVLLIALIAGAYLATSLTV